jgi:hypothetical protein
MPSDDAELCEIAGRDAAPSDAGNAWARIDETTQRVRNARLAGQTIDTLMDEVRGRASADESQRMRYVDRLP